MFLDWDADGFRRHYREGLLEILRHDSVGGWILVLANSMQEPELREALRGPVDAALARLQSGLAQGSEEDLSLIHI